jgi:dephospho-CoA kinase
VWLTGCPSAGKSFIADYLESKQGWVHIDGDAKMYSKDEKDKKMWTDLVTAFGFWGVSEEAPGELWHEYY